MGEFNFLLFWGHGHLEECSTICPMSPALYGLMGESNFIILPCVQVMCRVLTNGRIIFLILDISFVLLALTLC